MKFAGNYTVGGIWLGDDGKRCMKICRELHLKTVCAGTDHKRRNSKHKKKIMIIQIFLKIHEIMQTGTYRKDRDEETK